jgi:HPt (histidine-containing phosphotransfer) domain-containing protein
MPAADRDVDPELDLRRLAELERLLGTQLPEIVATLVTELNQALSDVAHGLEHGDLEQVAAAAHAARNSALMIDAQPMLRGLGELETCARRNDLPPAAAVHEQLLQDWPRLRRELELAAERHG